MDQREQAPAAQAFLDHWMATIARYEQLSESAEAEEKVLFEDMIIRLKAKMQELEAI